MNFGKHNWVCSLCGQGLTRKSTAKRHNYNLHFGGAMIVRPYDYIIGRLNGTFLQSDPLFYRQNNRNLKDVPRSTNKDDGNINRTTSGVVPDNIVHEGIYGDIRQPGDTKSNNFKSMFYPQSEAVEAPHSPTGDKSSDVLKISDRMLKLKEIDILVNKLYSSENANQIRMAIAMQANLGDDDSLDKNLTFLRNIDRARYGTY
jgi:hypothetical protein